MAGRFSPGTGRSTGCEPGENRIELGRPLRRPIVHAVEDHERLVRRAAEYFSAHAATVTTQHPIDLLMTLPKQVIFEAKILRGGNAIFAIREAIGQLFEYQHFIGPKAGLLFILLVENPGRVLVEYVENVLELGICWMQGDTLFGGPHSGSELSACGMVAISPSG